MNDVRATFEKLQSRLPEIWRNVETSRDYDHTSVVVPSLSLDREELSKVEGASYYEERLLFTLIRLRNPNARVLYVTSQPIHPDIVDYYLQLLPGVPAGHARRRLLLGCVYDASAEPLTAKLLRRPRLMARMREWIGDRKRAYLTCFNATTLERELAVRLGIPLNGLDPELLDWGTKSGSREVFARAGVRAPPGFGRLYSVDDVVDALMRLSDERPDIRRAVVKLNSSFSGEGNAVFVYPAAGRQRRGDIQASLRELQWTAVDESYERYMTKFQVMGGIVEEFIEGADKRSPSVQMRISPAGEVIVVSTHEQLLGGTNGQVYLGCRFPAEEAYRLQIQEQAMAIGSVLCGLGVVSRFSVDFLTFREPGSPRWSSVAIELNLRMGGTTHPFLALEFLTGGDLDVETGLFVSARGEHKFYIATDNLKSLAYRGLLPEDLVDVLVENNLLFQPRSETGTLFHMIGALSQYGKVGVTCFGNTPADAETLYGRTVETLDQAVGVPKGKGGRAIRFLDRGIPGME